MLILLGFFLVKVREKKPFNFEQLLYNHQLSETEASISQWLCEELTISEDKGLHLATATFFPPFEDSGIN